MATIMIAEPSAEQALLFARAVRRLGLDPVPFEDGAPAPSVDAVLLDPDWPAGVAAARTLGAPVIVCSTREPAPVPAYSGAVAHIVKPFSQDQLARAMSAALPAGARLH